MRRPVRRSWPAVLAVLAMVGAAGVPLPSTAQDGSLRARLRERLQQRQAQPQSPPASDAAASADGAARVAPGDTGKVSLVHDGLQRRYLVHVPRSYRPGQPTPVLFAFHGGGGHAEFQADDAHYGLVTASERAGFIAVFPNGTSRFPGGKLATWNAGACCGDARDRQVDDVGFVRAIHRQLAQAYTVDSGRIYATGMSNGGMLAHRLACEAADLFKAVAAVAGTDGTAVCTPSRPISVLHIHARNDDHVLFGGGAGSGAFRDTAKVTSFTSVPETIDRWVRRDRCAATPQRVLKRPGASCERYTGCADDVQVQLCVTETGGHSWPGAPKVRANKEQASQALDANDVMWSFFRGL